MAFITFDYRATEEKVPVNQTMLRAGVETEKEKEETPTFATLQFQQRDTRQQTATTPTRISEEKEKRLTLHVLGKFM